MSTTAARGRSRSTCQAPADPRLYEEAIQPVIETVMPIIFAYVANTYNIINSFKDGEREFTTTWQTMCASASRSSSSSRV